MAKIEAKEPNQSVPPSTEESGGKEPVSLKWFNIAISLLWPLLVLGLLYYFFVWKKIQDTDTRLITTLVVAPAILLLLVLMKTRHLPGLRVAPKTIILLLIIFGPIISSILLKDILLLPLSKVCIVLFFSLLPGWLYLQFISTKGKTLWDEYVLNLFRLHVDHYAHLPEPPERSIFHQRWMQAQQGKTAVHKEQSIYEKKFLALFGSLPSEVGTLKPADALSFDTFRAQAEKLGPVALATLIISVGWVLVMKPGSVGQVLSKVVPSNGLSIPFGPFCFAFLGAYFYILQMLVRRYFQNDLKTPAYINATLRIIVVVLLVWIVDLMLQYKSIQEAPRSALAFIIGVFPYVGWQALQALVKLPFQFVIPSLRHKHPLSDLDGLDIWYESRLLEEGIEDIQNLATADLVDVILNTRIPVDRLIDWVDQSLLYLHVSKSEIEGGKSDRYKLRRLGIRTATDLDDVLESEDKGLVKEAEYLLNTEEQKQPSVLRCVQATFKNEPNLYHVRMWKEFAERELKPEIEAQREAQ